MSRQDTGERYEYGGLTIMAQLISTIRAEYPGNTLYLDAGDQFQGGIESSKLISSGKIMNDFYGLSRVDGSAIGNHEFDFGPTFLFPFMSSKDSSNIAANLLS
jgi:2',3'-cyclic-nucleotide 2'-phosphodiesterase (5'-nucleotidase family)